MAVRGLPPLGDLFVEGRELVLRPPSDGVEAVVVWVNKLNPFQSDEARRAGAVARARVVLAMKEVGTPEYALYQSQVARMKPEQMREEILESEGLAWWGKAFNAVRQDPEWAEKSALVGTPVVDGASLEEHQATANLQRDYLAEIDRRIAEYKDERERELVALDDAGLREVHEEMWLDKQGMQSFSREFQRQQVFHAMRICRAAQTETGWDHVACDHSQKTCESVDDVTSLPDALIAGILTVLQQLTVPVDDARFSAEAASSSAPSPQPSKAEESPLSGQEVTSGELATTSS